MTPNGVDFSSSFLCPVESLFEYVSNLQPGLAGAFSVWLVSDYIAGTQFGQLGSSRQGITAVLVWQTYYLLHNQNFARAYSRLHSTDVLLAILSTTMQQHTEHPCCTYIFLTIGKKQLSDPATGLFDCIHQTRCWQCRALQCSTLGSPAADTTFSASEQACLTAFTRQASKVLAMLSMAMQQHAGNPDAHASPSNRPGTAVCFCLAQHVLELGVTLQARCK